MLKLAYFLILTTASVNAFSYYCQEEALTFAKKYAAEKLQVYHWALDSNTLEFEETSTGRDFVEYDVVMEVRTREDNLTVMKLGFVVSAIVDFEQKVANSCESLDVERLPVKRDETTKKLTKSFQKLIQYKTHYQEYAFDNHYFIIFHHLRWGQSGSMEWPTHAHYKTTSVEDLVGRIEEIFTESMDLIQQLDLPVEKISFYKRIYPDFSLLKEQLKGLNIRTCTITSTPAYSDGQSLTYILINNNLRFVFGYGLPD